MKQLVFRRSALLLLVVSSLCLNSSCQMIMPLLAMPFHLLGSLLGMFSSNPLGTAAAAAAVL